MDDGGPAFPHCKAVETNGVWNEVVDKGMTLRDYFASAALQGALGNPNTDAGMFSHYAKMSYLIADAMLAARKQDGK